MRTVGVRELKAKFSEVLRRVRGGEVVLVTNRGRVVAVLRGVGSGRRAKDPALYRRSGISLPPGVMHGLLAEERGDR